jgi:hypothetical protein
MIEVVPCRAEHASAWRDFLRASNNGTLFHDLDFLAYHPPDRFKTHHLLFFEDGTLCALLPAAEVSGPDGRSFLKSPYGASIGGLVLPVGQPAEQTGRLVEALKQHVGAAGLHGVEIRLGPSDGMRERNDHQSFALFAAGFRMLRRHLCHVIPLPPDPAQVAANCTSGKRRDLRMGLRRGLQPKEVSPDRLSDFYRVLLLNQAKHGSKPTHTEEELADLFPRTGSSLRMFLCEQEDRVAAAILVFVLNPRIAFTFYIAQDDAFRSLCPVTALLIHVAQQMSREGFSYLDLGPSTFDDLHFNSGLAAFKEDFGARGRCRDTWRWERD